MLWCTIAWTQANAIVLWEGLSFTFSAAVTAQGRATCCQGLCNCCAKSASFSHFANPSRNLWVVCVFAQRLIRHLQGVSGWWAEKDWGGHLTSNARERPPTPRTHTIIMWPKFLLKSRDLKKNRLNNYHDNQANCRMSPYKQRDLGDFLTIWKLKFHVSLARLSLSSSITLKSNVLIPTSSKSALLLNQQVGTNWNLKREKSMWLHSAISYAYCQMKVNTTSQIWPTSHPVFLLAPEQNNEEFVTICKHVNLELLLKPLLGGNCTINSISASKLFEYGPSSRQLSKTTVTTKTNF